MDPLPRLSVLLPVVTVLDPVRAVGPLNASATAASGPPERKISTYIPQKCSQGAVINHRLANRAFRWRHDRDWAIVEDMFLETMIQCCSKAGRREQPGHSQISCLWGEVHA